MLRRLHLDQPDHFAFTPANLEWAEAQITKYPEGREASAIIPLLWRAQEQEGWLTRPAIEKVAEMLGLAYMRALEVASFYFMFQLQPVGSVAHIQVCGTTSCMICGAEDLVAVCRDKIAAEPYELSADGKFSWEEVECLGSCSNAPMAQIGKDYYEDLTAEKMGELIDAMARGEVPLPGPQNGRFASEPLQGLTSLKEDGSKAKQYNASVQLAHDIGDTIKRIDGTEVPLLSPWQKSGRPPATLAAPKRDDMMPPDGPDGKQGGRTKSEKPAPRSRGASSDGRSEVPGEAPSAEAAAKPALGSVAPGTATDPAPKPTPTPGTAPKSADDTSADTDASVEEKKPRTLSSPRKAGADDLKRISGVGPKLEATLNDLGFWHFDQIAKWDAAQITWVDNRLKFKGRIERDDWVAQAAKLADGSE